MQYGVVQPADKQGERAGVPRLRYAEAAHAGRLETQAPAQPVVIADQGGGE